MCLSHAPEPTQSPATLVDRPRVLVDVAFGELCLILHLRCLLHDVVAVRHNHDEALADGSAAASILLKKGRRGSSAAWSTESGGWDDSGEKREASRAGASTTAQSVQANDGSLSLAASPRLLSATFAYS